MPPPGTQQHTTARSPVAAGVKTSTASASTPAGATSATSIRRRWRVRSGGFEALRQDDGLQLEERVEALGPQLAADARLLEATEGRREVHSHAVDAVRAGAHPAGDVDTGPRGGGPHRTPPTRISGGWG